MPFLIMPRAFLRFAIKVLCIAALSAPTTFAGPILWNLAGVAFDDGGTASGSFVYNADTNTFSSIHIITTSGSAFPGATYLNVALNFAASATSLGVIPNAGLPDLTGSPLFYMQFGTPLSNAGGNVSLPIVVDGTCADSICFNGISYRVSRNSGASVIAAPEPSSLTYIPLGALALFVIRRRYPFAFFTSATSAGTTSNKSPTMP